MIDRIKENIIGNLFTNTEDSYQIARINLVFNFAMYNILVLTVLMGTMLYTEKYILALFIAVDLIGFMFTLYILKVKENVKLSAQIQTIIANIIIVSSFIIEHGGVKYNILVWFPVIILYSYFTLGKLWGGLSILVAILTMGYYVNFSMVYNLSDIASLPKSTIVIMTISLTTSFVIISYFIRQFIDTIRLAENSLRDTNKQLQSQKDYIFKKNEEKTALIKEIHHRVKNNLQVVNSLLRLQAGSFEDKKIVSMFEEAQNRVVSMALMHEQLYQSNDLEHIDIPTHLTILVEHLVNNYKLDTEIQLDIQIENITIDTSKLTPLSLIINEIIANALKYAFVGMKKGTLTVELISIEDEVRLTIADNGIGKNNSSDSENKNTLGSDLIEIFTEQIEGKMSLSEKNGTCYQLTFKE